MLQRADLSHVHNYSVTRVSSHTSVTYMCSYLQKDLHQMYSKSKSNSPRCFILFPYSSSCNAIKFLKFELTISVLLDHCFTVESITEEKYLVLKN